MYYMIETELILIGAFYVLVQLVNFYNYCNKKIKKETVSVVPEEVIPEETIIEIKEN